MAPAISANLSVRHGWPDIWTRSAKPENMLNVPQIKTRYQRLCRLVSARKVKDALDVLGGMVTESGFSDFFIQQEHLEHTYEQMLNYMLEGVQDPERDRVYSKLLTSILELADRVRDLLMEKHSGWHTYIPGQMKNAEGICPWKYSNTSGSATAMMKRKTACRPRSFPAGNSSGTKKPCLSAPSSCPA
jgi:hypothetical protein